MQTKSVKTYIYFNTLFPRKKIWLIRENKIIQRVYFCSKKNREEPILFCLDKILKKSNLKIENISAIIVNKGPGHFTSVRKILIVVNILSWYIDIPAFGIVLKEELDEEQEKKLVNKAINQVNKLKTKQMILPVYLKGADIKKSN